MHVLPSLLLSLSTNPKRMRGSQKEEEAPMVREEIPMESDEEKEFGRFSNISSPPFLDIRINIHGTTFHLNKRCMASKSAKFKHLIKNYPQLSVYTITDVPTDPKTFSSAVRFCHGYDAGITATTVIPLACLAAYLEMTEDQCPMNLLYVTLTYVSTQVLPSWNKTVKAYKTVEPVLDCASQLGLVEALVESIADKVRLDPCLLMNPIEICGRKIDDCGVKRRLFSGDWCVEDLTGLSLKLFVMAMAAVVCSGVEDYHVAQCLYRYVKKRVTVPVANAGVLPVNEKSHQREVIEEVEKLLPKKKGVLHERNLFEILRSAISLEACVDCRNRLEARIAGQLGEAELDDLLLPTYDYTCDTQHDFDSILRILTRFSSTDLQNKDDAGDREIEFVVKLLELFLPTAAKEPNLKKETFTSLLGKFVLILNPERNHDGVYHAVDTYLRVHPQLTESEREELCKLIEVRKMTTAACEHATLNQRLPMRLVTQVLFIEQVRIREVIVEAMIKMEISSTPKLPEEEEEEEVERKVLRLEKECERMRDEIEKCRDCEKKKRKRGFWKEMKSSFGCKGLGLDDCSCYVGNNKRKKKIKKNGIFPSSH